MSARGEVRIPMSKAHRDDLASAAFLEGESPKAFAKRVLRAEVDRLLNAPMPFTLGGKKKR